MKLSPLGLAALAVLASALQAQPSAGEPENPQQCRAMVVAYRDSLVGVARSEKKAVDRTALKDGMITRARDCASHFNLNTIDRAELPELGLLYVIADNIAAAKQAFKRITGDTTLPPDQRAMATITAMQAMRMAYAADSGIVWAERYLPVIDSIPGVPVQKFISRGVLIGWYMSYDIDDKLMKAVDEMITFAKQMTPAEQQQHLSGISTAYSARASLYGSNLHADSAIALLKSAATDFPTLAETLQPQLAPTIARYKMVGKQIPTLHADYWLNDSTKMTSDSVTILMFTANWCHSCRSSYSTVTKLNEEFKAKGLRTIFAVTLDGVFEGVQMEPAQEVEANKKYFVEKHHFPYPIAIQRGDDEGATARNVQAFNVGGYPQFFVIDKQGIVRGILMGWDPYGNRERALTALLQQTL